MRRIGAVLATCALVVVLGACGAEDEPDLSGIDITVGSRDFTEQYVLSAILVEALDEYGADVTAAIPTGDIATTRAALESGEIDAYWEYNSAALVEVFDRADHVAGDADGEELTATAATLDAANDITWVGRSSFSNTYGFALEPALAEEHQPTRYSPDAFDLDDLAELLADEPDLTVCVEDSFVERADGLALFEQGTGFAIPDEQLQVFASTDQIYPLVIDGECDVAEVFTTDAQIAGTGLEVVEDPGIFLTYNVSLTVRDEVYRQAPEAFDSLVDDILGALSQRRMIELNGRAVDGVPLDEIAGDFVDEFITD